MFVTHSLAEAVFLSDRIVLMSARPGRIKTVIDVDEPHPRPPEFMLQSRVRGAAQRAVMPASRRDPPVHGRGGGVTEKASIAPRATQAVFAVAAIALWFVLTQSGAVSPLFLPPPDAVWQRIVAAGANG